MELPTSTTAPERRAFLQTHRAEFRALEFRAFGSGGCRHTFTAENLSFQYCLSIHAGKWRECATVIVLFYYG